MIVKIKRNFITSLPLGALTGLLLSSHAIRSVIHIDFHKIVVFLLLLLISCSLSIVALKKELKFGQSQTCLLLFILIFLIYVFLTGLITGNFDKLLELFSVLLPLGLFILIKGKDDEINIIKWLVILSCFIQAVTILVDRNYVFHWILNYLLVTSLLPVAIIFCFGSIWNTKRLIGKIFYLCTFVVMSLGLMQGQARYSAMAAVVGIIIVFILNFKKIVRTAFGQIFLIITIMQIPFIWSLMKRAHAFRRFLEFDIYNIDRIEIIRAYILIVRNNWITGFGVGNTPELAVHFYPHNYILEFLTEFGVLGLGFAILVTLFAATNLARTYRQNNSNDRFVAILLVYYVLFFLKSATIYDAYVLFTCFGLALSRSRGSA